MSERNRGRFNRLIVAAVLASGCSTSVLKHQRSQEILKNEEFDKQMQVSELLPEPGPGSSGTYVLLPGPEPVPSAWLKSVDGSVGANKNSKNKKAKTEEVAASGPSAPLTPPEPESRVHEPALEDAEGFIGRRPNVDPFRAGEKVTLEASYFGVTAGELNIEVRPFVKVNGRKSYHFAGTAKSTSVFAMFYAVDDWFETFVDFQTMTPSSYALHVKESKQLRETRCIFNWSKSQAKFWDKKIDSEDKVEERRFEWDIPKYAQNIFTSAYYLRNFQLRPGKKVAYVVSHEKENLTVTGEVIRREKLSTPVGELDTVVIKPKIELNGVFKPVGDVFIWLTDDDRKYIVRIESKIRIGTIVASVTAIQPGRAPASSDEDLPEIKIPEKMGQSSNIPRFPVLQLSNERYELPPFQWLQTLRKERDLRSPLSPVERTQFARFGDSSRSDRRRLAFDCPFTCNSPEVSRLPRHVGDAEAGGSGSP